MVVCKLFGQQEVRLNMKRIIIAISTILGVIIISLVIVLLVLNRKTRLIIESYDYHTKIDLGEYEVQDLRIEKMDNTRLIFKVKSNNSFYNDFIKTNQGYVSDLDYDIDGLFGYGFLVYDNYALKYVIENDNSVEISELICSWNIDEDKINEYYSGIYWTHIVSYKMVGPMKCYLSYDRLNEEERYQSLDDERITFDMLVDIYSHISNDYYKIENDTIYLKGYVYGSFTVDGKTVHFNNDRDIKYLTDMYLIKITLKDNRIVVENADK